jgi:hypothetical protein
MKVRSGFVSNSSSSSFMVLGIRYDKDDLYDIAEEHGLHCISDSNIVGIYMCGGDDYEVSETELSPEEYTKNFDSLKKIFGANAEIKLYSGMEYS